MPEEKALSLSITTTHGHGFPDESAMSSRVQSHLKIESSKVQSPLKIESPHEDPATTIANAAGVVELKPATAADLGLEEQEVPNSFQAFRGFGFDPQAPARPAWRVVALCTVGMINKHRSITQTETQAIFNIQKSLSLFNQFTPEIDASLNIRGILSSILGETPKPTAPYDYPEPLQRNAAILRARLDREVAIETSLSPEPLTSPTQPNPRKRSRPQKAQDSASISIDNPTVRKVMRGIIIVEGGRRGYKLDQDARPPPRNCDVVGHNGLTVGQWWPRRICALRDGAHGSSMGGIAGSANTGAYSIVVSSGYADLDKDHGNTLYYSGSNSHSNEDPHNPILSYATKALRWNYTQRRPVRVLRSGQAHGPHAPSKGIRYDGLYLIVSEEIKKNLKGGAYMRFRLVREADQPPVDSTRPTLEERRIYDALGDL